MAYRDHSYEELRAVVLDLLAGRQGPGTGEQYESLKRNLAHALARQEGREVERRSISDAGLSPRDSEMFLEIFWDLFRQGVITLGLNDSNREFPFYRVSAFGSKVLADPRLYFFHDVSSYEQVLREQLPDLDAISLLYLKEAMQAFQTGCLLSSTVMIGVAMEHEFLLLLDALVAGRHADLFKAVVQERQMLRRINRFKAIVEGNTSLLSVDTREDLDTSLLGVMSLIRTLRNEAGHPTGNIPSRELCYVLLNLFAPCVKKMRQIQRDLV